MEDAQAEFLVRAVRDTLDSIVSAGVRDALLAEALGVSGAERIPSELSEFLEFLNGPLRKTLERALGQELGGSVALELERLMLPLRAQDTLRPPPGSAERPSRQPTPVELPALRSEAPIARNRRSTTPSPGMGPPASRANVPTVPARPRISNPRPPISRDYPAGTASAFGMLSSAPPERSAVSSGRRLLVVFVATRDVELVRRFGAWLDPRAAVIRVSRLVDMLLDLQDAGDRRTVIVLDGHAPPIRAEALAALAEELPEHVRIVLWGGSAQQVAELSALFPRAADWLVCAEDAALADVADRCAELVG